jgi:hypothetical protein
MEMDSCLPNHLENTKISSKAQEGGLYMGHNLSS